MDSSSFIDRVLDSGTALTAKLEVIGALELWFKLLSWITLTAGVAALAKASDSYLLGIVSFISVILIFFHGIGTALNQMEKWIGDLEKPKRTHVAIALVLGTLLPVILLFTIFAAISGLLSQTTVTP